MVANSASQLFTPLRLRGVKLKNRIVISPMCQYSALDGFINDWHLVQLGRYALGGAGLIFVEASAIVSEGRITHGDVGIWSDEHIPGLQRLCKFIRSQGAMPAIQLSHAGRKGSAQRPWHGAGALGYEDIVARGESPWPTVAPSSHPVGETWQTPQELSDEDLDRLSEAWCTAAKRALEAGFEVIELHCAHGYLLHQFLSPLSNTRQDRYGGSRENRCRFPLKVARLLREQWPEDKPLFVRLSCIDGIEGGWSLEDTLYLTEQLGNIGVDLIDCSSGGLAGSATAARLPRGYGFQVPFSEAVKQQTGLATMAVGLIVEPKQAEDILQKRQADLIAIAREALYNPNWAHHAEQQLRNDGLFDTWPEQVGWWLSNRARTLAKIEQERQQ